MKTTRPGAKKPFNEQRVKELIAEAINYHTTHTLSMAIDSLVTHLTETIIEKFNEMEKKEKVNDRGYTKEEEQELNKYKLDQLEKKENG